jgi:hypothetical protein
MEMGAAAPLIATLPPLDFSKGILLPKEQLAAAAEKLVPAARAEVDNRQQWQQQSGYNQLKVTMASGGVDPRGGGGKQWRLTAIRSEMPMVKGSIVTPPTPLLVSLAGNSRRAVVAAARE